MQGPSLTTDETPPVGLPPERSGFAQEGETFQHYQVLRREDGSLWELGRGAMGVTYKAFDTNLRCHVALKVISAEYIHSETAGQRFVREARVAARLRHPHIASVYHLGVDPQGFFYAMEFIDGETLEDLVERVGPLPLETVLDIGLQVSRALAAASKQGLIHRDIKPANLMVIHEDHDGEDRLFVKMIDFGLARTYSIDDSNPQLTATGFVGTPLYSSPEQLEEQDLDVRSDIYSLGVTLWILLTGRPPFQGKMTQVITQHLHAPPPWWQLTGCPEPVRALLERTLHKNRLQRYQNAVELRLAIESCLRQITGRDQGRAADADSDDSSRGAALAGLALDEAKPAPANGGGAVAVRRLLGTVTGALGTLAKPGIPAAAGRADKPFAGRRPLRLRSPFVVAPAVILLAFLLIFYWHTPVGKEDTGRPSTSSKTTASAAPVAAEPTASAPAVATANALPSASPTAPPVSSTPSAMPTQLETPAPVPAAAATSPADEPPSSVAVTTLSGIDHLDGSAAAVPTVSPTATSETAASPAPSASPASGDGRQSAAQTKPDNPIKSQSNPTRSSRSRRSARPAATPTPNFFQKFFGIKPKPKPKSR